MHITYTHNMPINQLATYPLDALACATLVLLLLFLLLLTLAGSWRKLECLVATLLLRSLLEHAILFLKAGNHVALVTASTTSSEATLAALELAAVCATTSSLVSAVFLDEVLEGHVLVIHICSSDF